MTRRGGVRTNVYYVDGIESVERVGSTLMKINYYTLAKPPRGGVEQRVKPVSVILPCAAKFPDLAEWLQGAGLNS